MTTVIWRCFDIAITIINRRKNDGDFFAKPMANGFFAYIHKLFIV